MNIRGVLCVLVLGGLVVPPVPGFAQSANTASIAGIVKDTTGAVMPGVTVEAASPALIEKVRTVVTDGQGLYKIVDLRPGTYTVTFTLTGFSSVKREGLELNTGTTVTVNADLKVGSVEETITVSGATPVVDVQNVRTQNVLTRDTLNALPTAKNFQSLATLTLGVTVAFQGGDVGGNKGETVWCCQIHGSTDGLTTLEGLKTSSAYYVATAHRNIFNQLAVQEITMETSGGNAENESGGLNVNMVPKDGGNTVHTTLNLEAANRSFQNSNLNDRLKALGLSDVGVKKIYDVGGGVGGPIRKDKLWYFLALRAWGNQQEKQGNYFNKTQSTLFYTPDLDRPAYNDNYVRDIGLRLTYQATPKQKFGVYMSFQDYCQCYSFINQFSSPEGTWDFHVNPNQNFLGTWSYPRTSRLLLEAGASLRVDRQWNGVPKETGNARSVVELSTGMMYGSTFSGYSSEVDYGDVGNQGASQYRFSASYVTGSHAIKSGIYAMHGETQNKAMQPIYNVQYWFLNRVPVGLQQAAYPHSQISKMNIDLGLYAQDQWTLGKLTLNYGLRFDYLNNSNPAQTRPGGEFLGAITFQEIKNVPSWKDLSPRLGAAYDLFGNGKTALKVSFGRYNVYETTQLAHDTNPSATIANTTFRAWHDDNANYVVDCDLKSPGSNAECGPMANQAFGTAIVTTRYAKDVTEGFAVRPFRYQTAVSVQQELREGLGLTVAFFRNSINNIVVTDNLAVTANDYTPYCIAAPRSSALPGGGGYQVCGLYDISPSKIGQVNNLVTQSSNFGGGRTETYTGFEAGIRARFGRGGLLQGGLATGKTERDNCASPDAPPQFCKSNESSVYGSGGSWEGQTQIKFSGSYPMPYGIQLSGTFANLPGVPVFATYAATNAEIAPSLGRNLAACGGASAATCTATATVQLIQPYTEYEERPTLVDLRVSRLFVFGRARIQPRVDIYNLLNKSTVLGQVGTFGPAWKYPYDLYGGRLFKLGAQIDF